MFNPAVGLALSYGIATGNGASPDQALRAGIVGFVAPLAGVALATTTVPEEPPTPSATPTTSTTPTTGTPPTGAAGASPATTPTTSTTTPTTPTTTPSAGAPASTPPTSGTSPSTPPTSRAPAGSSATIAEVAREAQRSVGEAATLLGDKTFDEVRAFLLQCLEELRKPAESQSPAEATAQQAAAVKQQQQKSQKTKTGAGD